ncbi:Hypothetical predicted protein [Pelobates cultripes]|uniref:Uncharacterized protein n=1 Tax=Pelobates cultripes TaxID=61616 RepID=A0AAD1WR37_PELCU|nr:Hypothetical predicted protein [Pelobates cultripes]
MNRYQFYGSALCLFPGQWGGRLDRPVECWWQSEPGAVLEEKQSVACKEKVMKEDPSKTKICF